MRRTIIISFLAFFSALSLYATDDDFEISLSYTHNNFGVPFLGSPIGTQLYPGFQAGLELPLLRGPVFSLLYDGIISASFHGACAYGNVFKIGGDLIGRLDTEIGIYVDGRIGIGYAHIFSTLPTLTATSSSVAAGIDYGRPNMDVSLGVRLGWLLRGVSLPLRVFIGADCGLVNSFAGAYLAVIPNTTLSAGAVFPLGAN